MGSTTVANAFRKIVNARKTSKRFAPNRLIAPSVLRDILTNTIRSPSSFNMQPSQIVLVGNQDLKDKLADVAMMGPGNQFRTRDCSVLAVFLGDLEASRRIERINELEKAAKIRHPNYIVNMPLITNLFLGQGGAATLLKQASTNILSQFEPAPEIESIGSWSAKNTALLVQTYVLACTSHNLGTAIMEGFDARRVRELLHIPDRYSIPMVVATGYEYEEQPVNSPRLDLSEVVFDDMFGVPFQGSTDDDDINEAIEDEKVNIVRPPQSATGSV